MYLIREGWVFCSHFMKRALAARDAGYDVVVMACERAHGAKIRAAGLRLLPVSFSRCSLNPVAEMALLLRICWVRWRERPHMLHHVASNSRKKCLLVFTLVLGAHWLNWVKTKADSGLKFIELGDGIRGRA